MLRVILIFLTTTFFLYAQESPPAPDSPPAAVADKDKCTVEGKVVDAASGGPLRKVVVTLAPFERREGRPISVTTDADGIFSFKRVDPGRFRIIATRRGYVTQQYGQTTFNRAGTPLTLQPGQQVRDIFFRLHAGAVVSGRVLDEDGEPMANVQINALRRGYREGRRSLLPAGFASTNDLGEYRIFGLAPGEYFVRAAFNGNFTSGAFVSFDADQIGDSTYAPAFYPGVPEASQATPINLHPADDIRTNFTLIPVKAFSIRGKVINVLGPGNNGRGSLALIPRDEIDQFSFGPGNNTSVNFDGTFEFRHVLPGAYTIQGHAGDDKNQYSARQPVDVVDRNVPNVVVAFRPASDIPGRFTVTGTFRSRLQDLSVFLRSDSGFRMSGAGASAKNDGSFVIIGVADDLYRLGVAGLPPNAYIRSVRYGSEDVTERGLDPAGGRQSLDIVISADGGHISGLVTDKDQKAQPGITVVAVPDQPLRWIAAGSNPTSSDQNGRFNLQGLRPGRYRLYAFEEVEAGAYDDPQFMKKYLDFGKAVDVTENSQQSDDLTVIPREENQ